MSKKVCAFLVMSVLVVSSASAEENSVSNDLQKAFTSFARIIETMKPADQYGSIHVDDRAIAHQSLLRAQSHVEKHAYGSAVSQLESLHSHVRTVEARKALMNLIALVEAQGKQDAQAMIDDAVALMDRILPMCTSTESEEQIAELLNQLDSAQHRLSSSSPMVMQNAVRLTGEKVSSAVRFLREWAGVAEAERTKNYIEAIKRLNQVEASTANRPFFLSGDTSFTQVISEKRTSFLKKSMKLEYGDSIPELEAIDEIMKEIKTVEELIGILPKLEAVSTVGSGSYRYSQFSREIVSLVADIRSLGNVYHRPSGAMPGRHGVQYSGVVGQAGEHRWQDIVSKFREEIVLEAVAETYELGALEFEKKGQTIANLLLSLADKAAGKRDWRRVHTLLDAYRTIAFPTRDGIPTWLTAEIQTCELYLGAINLEAAEQYGKAAEGYRTVLKSMGTRVPIEEATKRLKQLKKEHPEEM